MHMSGSLLRTFGERVREYLDSPDLDSKYTTDYLVRHKMQPAMEDVIQRIHMMGDNLIVMRWPITLVKGVQYYQLPATVGQVIRVGSIDDEGWVRAEAVPLGEFHPDGPQWSLEGNLISFRPFPTGDEEAMEVWFIPSGQAQPHLAADGKVQLDSNGSPIYFDITTGAPALGMVDNRPNAYGGMTVRLLQSGMPFEERVIGNDDNTTTPRRLTVRVPFSSMVTPNVALQYEIVPFTLEPMLEAIVCRAAMKLAPGRKITQVQRQMIVDEYRSAIKTAHDQIGNMNGRYGKFFRGFTVDRVNREAGAGPYR